MNRFLLPLDSRHLVRYGAGVGLAVLALLARLGLDPVLGQLIGGAAIAFFGWSTSCNDGSTGCCMMCVGTCACGDSCVSCATACTTRKGCACNSTHESALSESDADAPR
jgi:hypothetical protein